VKCGACLDCSAGLPESSFFHSVTSIVGFDFEQAFKDDGKLGQKFLERQNLDVVFVHTQMPAMAFDWDSASIVEEVSYLSLASSSLSDGIECLLSTRSFCLSRSRTVRKSRLAG